MIKKVCDICKEDIEPLHAWRSYRVQVRYNNFGGRWEKMDAHTDCAKGLFKMIKEMRREDGR